MKERKGLPETSYIEFSTRDVTIWRGMKRFELINCTRFRTHKGYILGDSRFREFVEFHCEEERDPETYTYRLDKETFFINHRPNNPLSVDQRHRSPLPVSRLVTTSIDINSKKISHN